VPSLRGAVSSVRLLPLTFLQGPDFEDIAHDSEGSSEDDGDDDDDDEYVTEDDEEEKQK